MLVSVSLCWFLYKGYGRPALVQASREAKAKRKLIRHPCSKLDQKHFILRWRLRALPSKGRRPGRGVDSENTALLLSLGSHGRRRGCALRRDRWSRGPPALLQSFQEKTSLAVQGLQIRVCVFWNAGPGRKWPESLILYSFPLTLPSKPERSGLPWRPDPESSVSSLKGAASGPGARGELRTDLPTKRGPFGLQDVKTQARVRDPKHPLKEGGLGGGAEWVPPSTVSLSLYLSAGAEAALPRPPCPARRPVIFCLRLGSRPRGRREPTPHPRHLTRAAKRQEGEPLKEAQAAMWRAGRKIIFIGLAFHFPNDIYLTVFDSIYETSPVNRIYTHCAYNCLSAPKPIAIITAGSS